MLPTIVHFLRTALCAFVFVMAPVCMSAVLAAPNGAAMPGGGDLGNGPLKISSDTMTYDAAKSNVVFKGTVYVEREALKLWANTITLYLKPSEKKDAAEADMLAGMQTGDVDRIVAEGNVKFSYNAQNGESQKATYTASNGLLVLEGNPILRDGENFIKGTIIKYYMNENKSEVLGGQGRRVEAVFSQPQKAKAQ